MTWYKSAVDPGVHHLMRIKRDRYPKSAPRKMTCGMNSQNMDNLSFVYAWFRYDMKMPSIICETPIRIDIFIFKEFKNGSSDREPCQMGSTPNAYAPSPLFTKPVVYCVLHPSELSFGSHTYLLAPNQFIGTEKHSL